MAVPTTARSRRDEYSESTRAALVAAARRNFAEAGYDATSIETIARDARVTRGALYHHFADKRALFEAVVRQIEGEVTAQVQAAAAKEQDPWAQVEAGFAEFLSASQAPEYRRIVFEDSMAVLGWQRVREIDFEHALGGMRAGLEAMMDAGIIVRAPSDLLAHIIAGAFAEAALAVAADDSPGKAEVARKLVMRMLAGLKPDAD